MSLRVFPAKIVKSFQCFWQEGIADILHYGKSFISTGTAHLLLANLFGQFLSFGSALLVVKFLSREDLAEARVIQTYGGYVLLIGMMGMNTAVVTFFPKSRQGTIKQGWLFKTLLLSTSVTAILAIGVSLLSSRGLLMSSLRSSYWFRWSLIGVIANVGSGILTSYYQAEHEIKKLSGVQSVVRSVSVLFIILGAWLAKFEGYITGQIAGAITVFLGLLIALKKVPVNKPSSPLPSGFIAIGLYACIGNMLWTVGRSIDIVIMDRVVMDRALFGCYALATIFVMVPALINTSIQSVASPIFSQKAHDINWVIRRVKETQCLAAIFSLIVSVIVFFLAKILVGQYYGPQYSGTISLLAILLGAFCVSSSFHMISAALVGLGKVRLNTTIAAVVIPSSVILTFVLIKNYGIRGGAWAQFISSAIYAIVQISISASVFRRLKAQSR